MDHDDEHSGVGRLEDWVLGAVPDGLWVWDDAGVTVFANARLAEMLGRTPGEMVGFSVHDALGAPDRLASNRVEQELTLARADGSSFRALVSRTPLADTAGRPRGWLHRFREHTAEQRVVDELAHHEVQLGEAQSIARIGSWERDMEQGVLRWSDELYRVLEIDPDTFVPRADAYAELLHPDDLDAVRVAYEEMLAGGPPVDIVSRLRRPPGASTRWVRTRGRMTLDESGTILRIGGTVQDITEEKESEQGLAFLSAMAAAANEAQTLEEALLAADTVVRPFTQWPAVVVSAPDPDHDDGRLVHFESGWGEFTAAELAAAQALAVRVAAERRVLEERGPDGTFLVGGPVQVGERLACVVVSDSRAATPPRSSELAIFGQMLTLLAHVSERERAAGELAVARDAALAASRAKSDFLATMSHEIRTPLNGVIGLSELLNRTDLTPHQRRLSQGVDQAGRALLALVNDILDLSKIEAGRLELEEVDFDPYAVIEQSVGLMAERAGAQDLELVVSSADGLPSMVRGDPVRFGQVITNLVSNAVKFTQAGEVVVRAGATGTVVRVEVRDTGIGITPAARRQLFTAFSQADSSTTREYGGTGLGLAISKRIVEAAGGTIGVESEVGVGSTFWFTIPFGVADPHEPPRTGPGHRWVAGLRVLVVDDNDTNRFILGEQLESWGVRVTAVDSAYDALVELDASARHGQPYDVALVDYMMPGADGEQLARMIRAEERHRDLRLALLSSAVQPSHEWLADAGFDAFLGKPVLRSGLLDLLTSLGGTDDRTGDGTAGGAGGAAEPDPGPEPVVGSRGRLLVVEDNAVNQLVATGSLRALGFDLMIAENGAEAVSALADDPDGFDAILMDCQMPVMDGFDATRAIRAMRGDGARIPIIAMTASATEEERERCRQAGMDDFLTKPVVAKTFAATLERWVPTRSAGAERRADEARPDDLDPCAARLQALVDGGLDPALVLTIVGHFDASASDTAAAIEAAARTGDPTGASNGAHQLKGSADNLGLVALADLCREIERLAREGAVPDAAMVAALHDGVAAATAQLHAAAHGLRAR